MSRSGPLSTRAAETLRWIRDLGVVLQSARGPVPNVAEYLAGERIVGSWWGHPAGKEVYSVQSELDACPEIVATRLIDNKVTLLHSRVWSSIVCVSAHIDQRRLTSIHSEHTASGAHRSIEVPFPLWVPDATMDEATTLNVEDAFAMLPVSLRGP